MSIGRGLRFAMGFVAGTLLAGPAWASDPSLEKTAECIANSGAVFYGAHWCPYCRRQLESFQPYAHLLPYVECYEADRRKGMRAECRDAGVEAFPTWHFPDGTVVTGARSPEALARATGCR